MPMRSLDPSESPAAFVGALIRKLRLAAGMTIKDLAEQLQYDESTIAKIERGERVAQPDLLDKCDPIVGADGWLIEMKPLVGPARYPTSMRSWLPIEREAAELDTWQPMVVHGLLQTEDYARAVIRAGQPGAASDEVEELVAARLERQALLQGHPAPMLLVVLDESVLWRQIGGEAVMREQLSALLEASQHERITIQVVPAEVGAHAGLLGA